MIEVEYHDDLKEVQGDAALAALLASPCAAAPFDRLEWWRLIAEECGLAPLIAIARAGDCRAVLPLTRNGRRVEGLANWYSFRLKPLCNQPDRAPELLAALASDLAGEAPRISLRGVPDEQGEASMFEAAFPGAGWVVMRESCDTNHYLETGGRSFAEYLATRPGQLRTTLKRRRGRVETVVETNFSAESWALYEGVYARSWKPAEGSPAFLRRFAEAEGAAGRLRLGIARLGGEAIAAQFWTVENNTAFIHKLAHTDDSRPLSPGTVLSAALLEHVIDRDRVTLVDFGTGDDGYKRDWMEQQRPRYQLDLLRPCWPGNWPAIGKGMGRRLLARSGMPR